MVNIMCRSNLYILQYHIYFKNFVFINNFNNNFLIFLNLIILKLTLKIIGVQMDNKAINYGFALSLLILSILAVMFIAIPILTMFLSPGDIKESIMDREVINALITTIKAGFFATFICLILGVPIGYILSRYNFKFKNVVEGLIDVPMAIPHSVIGIMILSAIYNTPLNDILSNLSIRIVDNFYGIVVVMAYVGLPFMVNSIKNGFEMIDEELEYVSRTLGASFVKTFFDISLPLIRNNIISGSILTFARGISEVGAIMIVAYFPMTVPILIYSRFTQYGLTASKPIALIMIIISIILFALFRLFQTDKGERA